MAQESRYINPLTDYGFKKIFGDKEVMTAFLTDLLEPASPIADIIFLDKDMGAESEYERGIIYDLRCKTEDGSEFIVEMQNKSQLHFSDRILYYLSRSFSNQERKGDSEWDYELKPVYGIFFLNFHMKGFKPMSVRTVQLKIKETGELFTDKMRAYTLELPDYRGKSEADCKTKIDYWLYILVNMETMTMNIPFQSQQPIFGKVGGIAELIHMSAEERSRYNISLDSYRTNLSAMKNERAEGRREGEAIGIQKGMQKGMQKGRKEGRKEGEAIGMQKAILNTAKKMKMMGVDSDIIATATGLSVEEIEKLF